MLSTTGTEYMATKEAVKEALCLKGLVGDLDVSQKDFTVFCDRAQFTQLRTKCTTKGQNILMLECISFAKSQHEVMCWLRRLLLVIIRQT